MRFDIFRACFDACRHPHPFEMIGDSAARGFFRIRFRVGHRGQTALDGAPMIQDPRNVSHLFRLEPFHAAQREIVILRTLEPFAESADFVQKLGPINAEVVDKILPEKKLRIPIRFKEWI